jgi:hypothetical protein
VNGIAQKEFSNTMFYSAPEFYLYLKRSSNDYDTSLALNFAQSQILMNRKVTNPDDAILSSVRVQSLLNPDNIHIFFFDYTLKKYDAIKLRFGLSSNRQVDAMYGYLLDSTQRFLSMDCSYDSVAYASLLQKALNNSWTQLRDTLPIEVIARSIAYRTSIGIYNCIDMVDVAY